MSLSELVKLAGGSTSGMSGEVPARPIFTQITLNKIRRHWSVNKYSRLRRGVKYQKKEMAWTSFTVVMLALSFKEDLCGTKMESVVQNYI